VQAFFPKEADAMFLRDILNAKGTVVHTIAAEATLEDVVAALVRHNCGSLVVYDKSSPARMLGIVTERDILRSIARTKAPLAELKVLDTMTSNVVVGAPSDSVEDTMGLMTNKRIRHLPVVEDDQLLGLVSIGDIVKMQHDRLTMENHYLKSYLQS
jgi:signal-transduction protein with cAMP-binding, CBS, and nucleotidyltransferase domain